VDCVSRWRGQRSLGWALSVAAWLLAAPGWALVLPRDAVVETVHPGVVAFKFWRGAGPHAIYGFVWDRRQSGLESRVALGREVVPGLAPTSRAALRLAGAERQPVAAINGDFFTMTGPGQGATVGLCVRDGELLGLPFGRPAFAVLADGNLRIGTVQATATLLPPDAEALPVARVNNTRGPQVLVLYSPAWGESTHTGPDGVEVALRFVEPGVTCLRLPQQTLVEVVAMPELAKGNLAIPRDGLVLSAHGTWARQVAALRPGTRLALHLKADPAEPVQQAIGGSAVLVRDGAVAYVAKPNEPRHPRSALGFDQRQAVAVVVDGRRPGHSIGMTLPELAALLKGLGCREGLNLDGGGSSTCWVRGKVVNRPSDGSERAVANALALVSLGPIGAPNRIVFDAPPVLCLTPSASVELSVRLTDERCNPLPRLRLEGLAVEGGIGRIVGTTFTAGERPGRGRIVAPGGLAGEQRVEVVAKIASLQARPARLELAPGDSASVSITGVDAGGRTVVLDPRQVRYELPAAVGRVADGTVTAGAEGAQGALLVSGYGATIQVPVAVAGPRLIEDFARPDAVSCTTFPAAVTATLERLREPEGDWYARLAFRFGPGDETRAAYLRLDRALERPLLLRARVRGEDKPVWLRVALTDGNGQRLLYTLFRGTLGRAWRTVTCRLPDGVKAPARWQSAYAVAADADAPTEGFVDWAWLEVLEAR
jgi:hypothetical protein